MKREPAFWVGLWMLLCAVVPYLLDVLPGYDTNPTEWITAFLVFAALLNFYVAHSRVSR